MRNCAAMRAHEEVCKTHCCVHNETDRGLYGRETGGVFGKGSSLKVVGLREETKPINLFEGAEEV